jgi:hypothetical protein
MAISITAVRMTSTPAASPTATNRRTIVPLLLRSLSARAFSSARWAWVTVIVRE